MNGLKVEIKETEEARGILMACLAVGNVQSSVFLPVLRWRE